LGAYSKEYGELMNSIEIDVEPTKKLFIDMLTRDILLSNSIIDLLDNSIDAAVNHSTVDEENYLKSFRIDLTINKNEFRLIDNCGGISLKDATEYAFVFGRPKEVIHTAGNIGQFGIGMKRTIFKIGKMCTIKSLSFKDSFELKFDIIKWIDQDEWKLDLLDIVENLNTPLEDTKTDIHIENLNTSIANEFEDVKFIKNLKQKIQDSHYFSLKEGLKIFINNIEVKIEHEQPQITYTEKIGYFLKEKTFYSGNDTVKVKIYAGLIAPRDLNKAGWYIYCNNRLLLDANRDFMTGWNFNNFGKFHQNYAFFRGYVYFESINGDKLPWTTTKDGINFGSEVYQNVLSIMQAGLNPILTFLNDYAKEKDFESKEKDSTDKSLIDAMDQLEANDNVCTLNINSIESTFESPSLSITSREVLKRYASVSYRKPKSELDDLKKHLLVTTYKEVGLATYDYYIENEMD
jgi:hypothetical protein